MKKKDVAKQIYDTLGNELKPFGFVPAKRDSPMIRSTLSGDQRIYIALYDYAPDFVFTLTFGNRINYVEEICQKFFEIPDESKKITVSTLTPLGYFIEGGGYGEYKASNPEQLSACLSDLTTLLKVKVLPILDQCTEVAFLERIANSLSNPPFNIAVPPYGAMTLVTLAWMTKNPNISTIIKKFREEMREYPDSEVQKFEALVAQLATQDPN